MQFRKKPVVVEATQWFKLGDHPLDERITYRGKSTQYTIVSSLRNSTAEKCKLCGASLNFHGWVETLEGGHIVCPGDWIITGIKGEFYPCKPDIFEATYEAVE